MSTEEEDMMTRRSRTGFTLIELMVVVAVVGILAAMLVPAVSQAVTNARVTRTGAELRMIADAMNMYLADVGSYPPTVQDWGRAWGDDVGLVDYGYVKGSHRALWKGPYFKEWPRKTAWGGLVGCGAQGAYYVHNQIGWINRDGVGGNDLWIHMNPYCAYYPPAMAILVDRAIDDGVAWSGNMRLTGGWPEYIYWYVGEGPRS